MIFAARKQAANKHDVRADRREDESAGRVYVEPSPCLVMPAVNLSALIPARFGRPQTILDYLT